MALSDSEHFEVERIVKRLLGSLRPSVAAQQDGTDVSDGQRVLNFQGAGVIVTEETLQRRVNINIPGVRFSSAASVINSDATAKYLSLWNGSSNNSPPSNWETTGFNDSSWSAAVVAAQGAGQAVFVPSGASTIWSSNTPSVSATPGEKVLIRKSFTLPSATILSATMTAAWDAWGDIYLNGTLLGSDTEMVHSGPQVVVSVSPALFNLGGTNVIAVMGNDDGGGGGNRAWATFQLSYYSGGASSSSATLGSDVAITSTATFQDVLSVTLGAGTWLILTGLTMATTSGFATDFSGRITDGTTTFASAQAPRQTTVSGITASLFMATIVSPGSSTTYKLQGASANVSSSAKAAISSPGAGNNATYIRAVLLG